MDSRKVNRGNESQEHIRMKRDGITALRRRGYSIVFPEHRNCDLVAVRHLDFRYIVVGVEFERSIKNLWSNVSRNFANGCNYVLVVTSTENLFCTCSDKLLIPPFEKRRPFIYLITFDDFIAGKLPYSMSDLCSDFVRLETYLCSRLFGVCSAENGVCSDDPEEVQH